MSILYIEGLHVILSKNIILLSMKIDFALASSADPNKIPHNAAFHLGLPCFSKYPYRGFQSI